MRSISCESAAILDSQPDGLKSINEILDEDAFEQHLLHVLAYTKFEEYGDSLQKLVSMLDIQVLRRSIINAYQSQMQ